MSKIYNETFCIYLACIMGACLVTLYTMTNSKGEIHYPLRTSDYFPQFARNMIIFM